MFVRLEDGRMINVSMIVSIQVGFMWLIGNISIHITDDDYANIVIAIEKTVGLL